MAPAYGGSHVGGGGDFLGRVAATSASPANRTPPSPLSDYSSAEGRRSPLHLRHANNPRTRFKDSYGPPSKSPSGRQIKSDSLLDLEGEACQQGAADAVQLRREARLQRDVEEAQEEIQQLRRALRSSATALQHASALLPPELRRELDAHREILDDLTKEIQQKDSEILRLGRVCSSHEQKLSWTRDVVSCTLSRWMDSQSRLLLHEVWMPWSKAVERLREAKNFQKAMDKCKVLNSRNICVVVQGLFGANKASEARAAMSAWLAVSIAQRAKTKQETSTNMLKRKVLLRWETNDKHSLLLLHWSSWQSFHEGCQHDKRAEQQRWKHVTEARELRLQTLERTLRKMCTTTDRAFLDHLHGMTFKAWRESARLKAIDLRASEKAKLDQQRIQEAEEQRQEGVRRNILLLLGREDAYSKTRMKLHLGSAFETWRERLMEIKSRRKDERVKLLLLIVGHWRNQAREHRREREIEGLRQQQEALKREHAERLRQTQEKRAAMMFLVTGQGVLAVALSAWKEHCAEVARQKREAEQREQWERERKAVEQEAARQQRLRGSAVAFATLQEKNQEKDNAFADRLIRATVWSAWSEVIAKARRDKTLESAQLIHEEEQRKLKERHEEEQSKIQKQHEEDQFNLKKLLGEEHDKAKASFKDELRKTKDLHEELLHKTKSEAEKIKKAHEDDVRRAKKAAEQLELEARRNDERHHDLHLRRKMVFIMSLQEKDRHLLLQTMMVAWQRCWQDRKADERALRTALEGQEHIRQLRSALESLVRPALDGGGMISASEPEEKLKEDDSPARRQWCQCLSRCFVCPPFCRRGANKVAPARTPSPPKYNRSGARIFDQYHRSNAKEFHEDVAAQEGESHRSGGCGGDGGNESDRDLPTTSRERGENSDCDQDPAVSAVTVDKIPKLVATEINDGGVDGVRRGACTESYVGTCMDAGKSSTVDVVDGGARSGTALGAKNNSSDGGVGSVALATHGGQTPFAGCGVASSGGCGDACGSNSGGGYAIAATTAATTHATGFTSGGGGTSQHVDAVGNVVGIGRGDDAASATNVGTYHADGGSIGGSVDMATLQPQPSVRTAVPSPPPSSRKAPPPAPPIEAAQAAAAAAPLPPPVLS
eukprot:TRINITY_DN24116_c0_g2_i1.p1 TRINITY_DN24116_c0_g2~~TRINITY_DN24116_c0_g2_i1.p1  ORF type:complete len:1117 (-),score=252.72 TRINITY_DN24116_c0_g2_i1:308-3658(-)